MFDENTIKYNDVIRKAYKKDPDGLNFEMLAAVIIHLDKLAKQKKVEKVLIEAGVEKLTEDLEFYVNKVYFRNTQLKRLEKIINKVFNFSIKLAKKIPKQNKRSRNSFLKYIKRIKRYKNMILYYTPKE